MPTATIGTMNKKINSTKTSFSGTSHNVVLKAPTSRENPKLLITGSPTSKANYMSYAGWYYWVDDIVSVTKDLSWVVGHVDPLATWKNDIKATTGFINYGPPSIATEKKLVDPRFTPDICESIGGLEKSLHDFNKNGFVHLVIANYDPNNPCGTVHLVGSMSDFLELYSQYVSDLDTDANTMGTSFEKLLFKTLGFGNGLDYIMSASFVPFNMSEFQGYPYPGLLGPYSMSGTWYLAANFGGCSADPWESPTQLNTNGPHRTDYPWLQHPHYTKILVQSPGGTLDLSSTLQLRNSTETNITVRQLYNIYGDVTLVFYETSSKIVLGTQSFNVSVDLKNFLNSIPSPSLLGAKVGAQIGLTAVGAMAGVGGVISAAGEKIGSAALNAGSEFGLNVGVGTIKAGENLAAQSEGFVNTYGNGITGAAASISVSDSPQQFGGPNNLLALNFMNDDVSSDHIMFRCEYWTPEIIVKGNYDTFVSEYGAPVFDYGNLSANGPYQMAGAVCSASAPPASLSTINSTINNLIIIE